MKLVSSGRVARRGLAGMAFVGALAVMAPGCTVTAEEKAPGADKASAAPSTSSLQKDVRQALRAFPDAQVLGSENGIPFLVRGTLAQGLTSTADKKIAVGETAFASALRTIAPLFSLRAEQLMLERQKVDARGHRHLRYRQTQEGLPVIGGELLVHIDETGRIYAANGSARGGRASEPKPTLSSESAQSLALAYDKATTRLEGEPRLVYFRAEHSDSLELAWEVRVRGEDTDGPVDDVVYVHAHRGTVLDVHSRIHTAINREVHSANNNNFSNRSPTQAAFESSTDA